jgi:hypothetical protein
LRAIPDPRYEFSAAAERLTPSTPVLMSILYVAGVTVVNVRYGMSELSADKIKK